MKLLMTNVVYGTTYADIFLNHHLKSLLDESNIPAFAKQITYIIYTDSETEGSLRKHPNMLKLLSLCEVEIRDFTWRTDVNRFQLRYSLLVRSFQESVKIACERGMLLSAMVADLVFAKEYLPRVMSKIDDGFDSVFVLPARASAETIIPELNKHPSALDAHELWKLCHTNQHPFLFLAAHYDSPTFTKIPFYLLWNTGTGVMARSYSMTPIIFWPKIEMADTNHVIDIEIPGMLKRPYFATDWDDAPVIGVEPITCYSGVVSNFPASMQSLRSFSKTRHMTHRLVANVSPEMIDKSDSVVDAILK